MSWQDDPIIDDGTGGATALAPPPAPAPTRAAWQDDPIVAPAPMQQQPLPPTQQQMPALSQSLPGTWAVDGGATSPVNLQPFAEQTARGQEIDAAGYEAGARLGGAEPYPVTNLAEPNTQFDDLAAGGQAMRDRARQQLHDWLAARGWAADRTDQTVTREQFNQQNAQDPFPAEALRYLEPGEARAYVTALHQLTDPTMRGAAAVPVRSDIAAMGANLAGRAGASFAGLAPMLAEPKIALGRFAHDQLGVDNGEFMDQAYADKRQAEQTAKRAREDQQNIAQQLPLTDTAELLTGQADLGIKMTAGAVGTALTRNPKVGAAIFSGLFSADAAGQAYQAARERGGSDGEAQGDAMFSGIKAAIIAQLPMSWPSLARETAAVQMAGAYLGGTALTTGDAAADQAWRSLLRGEKFDQKAVERIGLAMLQGGLPAAALHGAHAAAHGTEAPPPGAHERPTRPDTMLTPAGEAGDYAPQPTRSYPPVDPRGMNYVPMAEPNQQQASRNFVGGAPPQLPEIAPEAAAHAPQAPAEAPTAPPDKAAEQQQVIAWADEAGKGRGAILYAYAEGGIEAARAEYARQTANESNAGEPQKQMATDTSAVDPTQQPQTGEGENGQQTPTETEQPPPTVPDRTRPPAETPQEPGGQSPAAGVAAVSIEAHGKGLIVVRGADETERSVFGPDGLGGRYNSRAGGWLFPERKAEAVRAEVEKQNNLNTPTTGPDGTVDAAAPVEPPPPDSAAGEAKGDKSIPGAYSRADVERRLLDWHRQSPDVQAGVEQGYQEHDTTEATGGAANSFHDNLPQEVTDRVDKRELLRARKLGILRVVRSDQVAGGPDALGQMGDDAYAQMIKRQLAHHETRSNALDAAKEAARGSDDPAVQFMAAVHDALAGPAKDRTPYTSVDAADVPAGAKFEFQGEPFRVVEDAQSGMKVLKDDGSYPEVPIEWLDKVPVDKGTMKQEKMPAPSEKRYADPAAAQERMNSLAEGEMLLKSGRKLSGEKMTPAEMDALRRSNESTRRKLEAMPSEPDAPTFFDPAAEGIKTGAGKGIFGQTTFDAATGNKQSGLPFHQPAEVNRASGDTPADARTRATNANDAGQGAMFERKPGEQPPTRVEYEGRRQARKQATTASEPLTGKDEPPPAEIRRQIADALFGPSSFVGADVKPAIETTTRALSEAAIQIQRALAPQSRGADAKLAKGAIREFNAELAQKMNRAMEATRAARWYFEGEKAKVNYDFIDRMEQGAPQDTPQLSGFARALRKLLDQGRRDVQALGEGKLDHFIEDYFPHLWKDPKEAQAQIGRILGKRPLEGTKAFLKKRSIDLFTTGIKAGLEPVSDNPVDLALLKYREMERYVFAHKVLADLKGQETLRYVPANMKPDEGYVKINDPVATVYGKPTVTVKEYVDRVVYEGLQKLAQDLGIQHDRLINAGRGALGFSMQGGDRVVTQFGTGEATFAHEIGHQLDVKYGLHDLLFDNPDNRLRPQLKRELRALADLKSATWDNPAGEPNAVHRQRGEQVAHVMEAYIHARERMHEVAPHVYEQFEKLVYAHPELSHIPEIQNSISKMELTNELPHGGMLIMGSYYAPEAAATVLNNHLSPGLRNKSGLMRGFMGAANFYNAVQLGLSAFHLGMTSIDASTSKLALAIQQAFDGQTGAAALTAIKIPIAPVENMLRGRQVMHAWLGDSYRPGRVAQFAGKYLLDPLTRFTGAGLDAQELAKIVDSVTAAGGRAKMDDFYRTHITDKMLDAFRKGNIAGGLLRAPFALFDTAAKPILEYIVPRQKLGVFADLARFEMERLGPDATRQQVREVMGNAWDSVDNRLGQVVYDNLFWDRTWKDLAMLSVRSVGWNLGTFRELGGGVLDFGTAAVKTAALGKLGKPELTPRMGYLLAAPVIAGGLGALMQLMLTGKGPSQLLDYFYPKTGKQDADGNEQRLSLPSYMKDVFAYAHHPIETLKHKVHPSLDLLFSMLENKDFYGTKIVNEDDPWMKRQLDRLKFAGKSLTPFGVQGYQKLSDEDLPGMRKVLPFIGFPPAPASLTQSKAEETAAEIMGGKGAEGGRTQAQADRAKLKRDLATAIKEKKPDAESKVQAAVSAGKLNESDVTDVRERAQMGHLEHMVKHFSAEEVRRVWNAAVADHDDEGMRTARVALFKKLFGAQHMTQQEKEAWKANAKAGKPIPAAAQ